MKTINYRGMTFEIEDHFKYIAMDADGSIYAYTKKPTSYYEDGQWYAPGDWNFKLLKKSDNNWRNSLENC